MVADNENLGAGEGSEYAVCWANAAGKVKLRHIATANSGTNFEILPPHTAVRNTGNSRKMVLNISADIRFVKFLNIACNNKRVRANGYYLKTYSKHASLPQARLCLHNMALR
jgi:hypothetical protein